MIGLGGLVAIAGFLVPPDDPAPTHVPSTPSAPLPTASAPIEPRVFQGPSPDADAAPPPAERVLARADLPETAAQWRRAVVLGQRRDVLRGALALRRAPDGREQLLTLVRDPTPRVRAYALRELGRRHDPQLAGLYRDLLTDTDPHVRENAAWALETLEAR